MGLCILEATHSSFGSTSAPSFLSGQKAASFEWGTEKGKVFNRSKLPRKQLLHMGYMIEQSQCCLKF